MDFLIVRKERFKGNSFVLEKPLIYLFKSFCGSFFANRKQLWNVFDFVETPLFGHPEIDVSVAIAKEKL